jgi:tetratricopeptide (TPR) repeat protein
MRTFATAGLALALLAASSSVPAHAQSAALRETFGRGMELYRAGRYAEAEPLFRRSLAIEAHLPGPPRPEAAQGLDNLAGMYEEQGRYAEAEPLYGRALAMLERALGPDQGP